MWFVFYCGITAFIVTFVTMPILINVLTKKQLLDVGGRRKIHKGFIPSMGGIAIFIGFLFAIAAWVPLSQLSGYKFLCAAAVFMFLTGFRDDFMPLSPKGKLVIQFLAAVIVAWGGGSVGIRLTSLYGFLGIYELPVWISYLVTVFIIIVITNAFNLIDGIDGLAGLIGLLAFTLLAGWFLLIGDEQNQSIAFALILVALIGAILAFLCYNWHPASIFMGDTGSLILGFFLAVGVLKFIQVNGDPNFVSFFKINPPISMAVAIAIIPLFDTGRIFILRINQKRSPFSPDKLHIHHLLFRIGLKHSHVTLVMGALYLLLVGVIYLLSLKLSDNFLIPVIIGVCVCLHFLLKYIVDLVFDGKRKNNIQDVVHGH